MSTGNLYIAIQPYFQTIVKKFGLEHATHVAESRQFAINYIEKNIKANNIHCQFTYRPWYAYTEGEKETELERELETFKQMNVAAELTTELPFDLKFKKAMVVQNQARFNPMEYVISMAEKAAKKGCLIYENSPVNDIKEETTHCTVTTTNATITAKKVFMATHTPLGINLTQNFTAPYRSYVIAARLALAKYPEGHLWNLDNPRYSISTHAYKKAHPELLLVAGSHHKTGQGHDMKEHFTEIERFLHKNFLGVSISYQWSAQHYHAADSLPYIGLAHRHSKHLYMATGYFADGLIYGTLAGILIADLILHKNRSTHNYYKAQRITPDASMAFLVKENVNILAQYAKDLPLPEEKKFKHIKKGEGKVVEINRKKCAVSRDDKNQLHIVCAVCPHMKCIVSWNNAEQTWDCPCHGSRFKPTGEVIEGPAMTNLNKYTENNI